MARRLTSPELLICAMAMAGAAHGQDIDTIYIVPTSHLDIGFTAPPSVVARKMREAAEKALALAEADPAYVWQFENFWQLEQWLDGRPTQAEVERLLVLLRSGRFGLSAAYATPHSCLMNAWALDWHFRLPTEWARARGLDLETVILNDVPGHPIDLPHFLAKNGVRYLLVGANLQFSKPLPEPVANTPFWWEAPTGERVLTWISSRSYTEAFVHLGIDPGAARLFNRKIFTDRDPLAVMAKGIRATLDFYSKRDYPYDAIVAMHAFDNWGSHNSAKVPRYAKLWNTRHQRPKIVPSTADAFFKHIETKYGPQLPMHRGGFGGQWDSVRCGIPTAMRVARRAEDLVRASAEPNPDDVRKLLAFYEHSFGMGSSWPRLMTREQAVQHSREKLADRSWLIGLALGQNLTTVFKGEGKGKLTLGEAYPGEAAVVEVGVTITRAGSGRK